MIFKELLNPTTTFGFNEDTQEFMFNGQSISQEMDWMTTSYINHDYKKLGFIMGDTIDKHAWSKDDVMDAIKNN